MELLQNIRYADEGLPPMRPLRASHCRFSRPGRFQTEVGQCGNRVISKENFSNVRERLRNQEPGLMFLRKSLGRFDVYAAPNLIYHYVEAHNYKPPDEFLNALREGLKPPDREYFTQLEELGLEWREAVFALVPE